MRTASGILTVVVLGSALFAFAAEPTTKPAAPKLFAPYSKMKSLNDEQKSKIREIHRKVLAEIRDIEKKQGEEIAALLNDEQKKELSELEATAKKEPAPKKEE